MSNSDFFSLFPAEDLTPTANADELAQLFDQNAPGDNGASTEIEAELDNFAVMFEEILLDAELETTAISAEQETDQVDQELNTAGMAIAAEFEFDEPEWGDSDNGLTTDFGAIVADIDNADHQDKQPEVFVHPLTPPFLQSYQTLQAQVAQLTEQKAIADQQFIAYQRRDNSAEALIHQQAAELTQAQEQLSHTVAELQIHQEETKRQQLQVETLAEQWAQSQAQLKDLSDQLAQNQAQLAIATTEKQTLEAQVRQYPVQVSRLEKQVEELRSRLQRQQRFALQYKSALEQCLAQPDFRPSSDISQVVARLTGQNTDFQPWASVGDVLAAFPSPPPNPTSGTSRSGFLQNSPVTMPTPDNVFSSSQPADSNENPSQPPQPLATPNPEPHSSADHREIVSDPAPESRGRRFFGPDTLSFAVREQRKAPDRHIDLPNFLARAVSVSR